MTSLLPMRWVSGIDKRLRCLLQGLWRSDLVPQATAHRALELGRVVQRTTATVHWACDTTC